MSSARSIYLSYLMGNYARDAVPTKIISDTITTVPRTVATQLSSTAVVSISFVDTYVVQLNFSSATNLSSVTVGSVAVVTGSTTRLSGEALYPHNGTHYVLESNNTEKYIRVHNQHITGSSLDELGSSASVVVRTADTITFLNPTNANSVKQYQAIILDGTGANDGSYNVVYSTEKTRVTTLVSTAVTTIEWQSGNTMRVTVTGADLSNILAGQHVTISGATNDLNNSTFVIVSSNDTNDTIDYINPNISDDSYDEGAVADVSAHKYIGTTTILETTLTTHTGTGIEKAVVPADYQEVKGTAEGFNAGDTITPSAIVSASGNVPYAEVTERTGSGSVDTELYYGQQTFDFLKATLGSEWSTEVDTDAVRVIGPNMIIVTDSSGDNLKIGQVVRLSGSTQSIQIGETVLYPNNSYTIIQNIQGESAPYILTVGKDLDTSLEGYQVLLNESGNPNLRLQGRMIENGIRKYSMVYEKYIENDSGSVPLAMLFGGQVVESGEITVSPKSFITLKLTLNGTGLVGVPRYHHYRGKLATVGDMNHRVFNAAYDKTIVIRNGIPTRVTEYATKISGLAGTTDGIGTPYPVETFRNSFNCQTTYSKYFSDPSDYNKYYRGCSNDTIMMVGESSPESCDSTSSYGIAILTYRNIRSGGELGGMAKDGAITEGYGNSTNIARQVGSVERGYREVALQISMFAK